MKNSKKVFLIVFLMGSYLVSAAQVSEPDGYINNGGVSGAASGNLVASVGEPVIGLLQDGWQHCLQGFVYKTIANDFSTSIDDDVVFPQADISLYPNPATDFLYVNYEISDYDQLSYSIYAENGRLMKNGMLDGTLTQISVGDLTPATYIFVLAKDSYGVILNRTKFVKL